jgi:MFS family permease
MFFISVSSLALYFAVIIVGFVSGGTFTLMGIIAHEDYGPKYIAKILGIFMTGAATGILLFDEVVFDLMYRSFASEHDYNNQKAYGKWNKYIFIVSLLASIMALVMSLGAYLKTRRHDGNKDRAKDFINL